MIDKVVDLANLHPGIEHYYRGTSNSKRLLLLFNSTAKIILTTLHLMSTLCSPDGGDRLHHRASVKPLNLVHYTGSDRLAQVNTSV